MRGVFSFCVFSQGIVRGKLDQRQRCFEASSWHTEVAVCGIVDRFAGVLLSRVRSGKCLNTSGLHN